MLWSRPWNVRGSSAVSPGGRTDSALQSTLSGCPAGSVAVVVWWKWVVLWRLLFRQLSRSRRPHTDSNVEHPQQGEIVTVME